MKKSLFVFCLLLTSLCQGQFEKIFFSGGGNWSKLKHDDFDFEGAMGFHLGFGLNNSLNENLDYSIGIRFNQKRSIWKSEIGLFDEFGNPLGTDELDFNFSLTYITLPLLLQIPFSNNLYLDTGTELSLLISDKVESQNPDFPGVIDVQFNNLNIGIMGGLRYAFRELELRLAARRNFLDISDDFGENFKLPISVSIDLIKKFNQQ